MPAKIFVIEMPPRRFSVCTSTLRTIRNPS